jgi:hypothetical protein
MPKAKPISLHPLSFEEAIKAIIRVDHGSAGNPQPKKINKSESKRKKVST